MTALYQIRMRKMSDITWAFTIFRVALLKFKGFEIEILGIERRARISWQSWSFFKFHINKYTHQTFISLEALWIFSGAWFIPGIKLEDAKDE
jgi:hypothetical protein